MLIDDTIEIRDEERTRCEVWTRVMGYHRPVSAFNAGKQSEHRDRVMFCETPQGQGQPSTARPSQPALEEERYPRAA